jgi:hypothetical protein
MGCGNHLKEGYVNVDKFMPTEEALKPTVERPLTTQFIQVDLEKADWWINGVTGERGQTYREWPWDVSTVDEVIFHHSLEHMGEQVDAFFHILKEVYRICKNGAQLLITVPHPRHDDFLNDPTHVRHITAQQMALYNQAENRVWINDGSPNTPLGLQLGIDFVMENSTMMVEPKYNGYPNNTLERMIEINNNMIKQISMRLKVRK